MIIPKDRFEAVESLYRRGLNLQAYKLSQTIAPLDQWEDTDAKILAANLAYNLGAPELSYKRIRDAWRKDRTHGKANLYYGLDMLHVKGALPTLLFVNKQKPDFSGDARTEIWWQCLYAEIYSHLHDFEQAEEYLKTVAETGAKDYWYWTAKSHIYNKQDLYEDSLKAAYQALKVGGWRQSSVLAAAHGFCLLEKYNDALALLGDAKKHLESFWVVKELADLQSDLGQNQAALENYEKSFELIPLRDKQIEEWLFGRIAKIAYLAGDRRKSLQYLEKISAPFAEKFKEQILNAKPTDKRVRLNIGFIRQHEMTCAPATLSNISRYWRKTVEHLELADEICYDGTPAHSQRIWAEQNGYKVKEFTVNWENVVELINRRVPLTLATIHPGNGHLQAIIGYDEIRKSFLIRDPYFQKVEEFSVEDLLKDQIATGPRGMALVPKEYAHLLDGIEFKDSRQYNFLFHIENFLKEHKRPQAVELLEGMKREFPDTQLTWRAHLTVAGYDANPLQIIEAVENLRKKYPDDINLKMNFFGLSEEHLSTDEKLKILEEFSKSEETHPLLWQMFGENLSPDARLHGKAMRWLYKALRCMPTNPSVYRTIADIYWSKRKFEEALVLYRIAVCLNDKDEQLAWSYFSASQHLQKTDKALQFLKDRFARFGKRSAMPARTLFYALTQIGLNDKALEMLDEAVRKRPEDAELKIFVAEKKAQYGQIAEAKEFLNEAEKVSPPRIWKRSSAYLAETEGDLKMALALWKEILELEPLATDAHQKVAILLEATESKKAAQDYLKQTVNNFPHHRMLHKLLLETMQDEEPKEVLPVIRQIISMNEQDAWSRRELARWLLKEKKYEQALAEVNAAWHLDPNDAVTHYTGGIVLSEMNRRTEAANSFAKALELSIDFTYAIKSWLDMSRTREEKLYVLNFVKNELYKQNTFGDGLLGYYDFAKIHVESEILLGELKTLLQKRPDLWSAWSVNICQLVDVKRLDEALEMALKAVERFPLTFQLYYDLSLVYKSRGEIEEQISSLKKGLTINPKWSFGTQQLTEALCFLDKKEEAKVLLEDAIRKNPLDQYLHGYLADVQRQSGEKTAAIETVKKALKLDSEYAWGWQSLKNWLREDGKAHEVEKLAWQLASEKPRDINSWLTVARVLDEEHQAEKQFEAVSQALVINQYDVRALVLKIKNLVRRGLEEKALRVCKTRLADGHHPEILRFYEAQILFDRERYQEAVAMLEDLTAKSPDFYPAWERLAEIYREIESKAQDFLRVTKAMTQLAPNDPQVFGYYGEACLNVENKKEAKTAFAQAFALAPDYEFAGCLLFDLQTEFKQKTEAEKTLQTLKQFVKNSSVALREMRLRIEEKNKSEVQKLWREICFSPTSNRRHIEKSISAISDSNLFPPNEKYIENSITEFLQSPEASENLSEFWVEFLFEKRDIKTAENSLKNMFAGSDAWRTGIDVYLRLLWEKGKKRKIRNFIKNNSEVLKTDNGTWSVSGYFINKIGDGKNSLKWFADWETRKNVKSWMLWNYSLTLRTLGLNEEANIIHKQALKLEEDHTTYRHQMMLGLESATAGNITDAKNIVNKMSIPNLTDWDKYFFELLMRLFDIDEAKHNQAGRNKLVGELVNSTLSDGSFWQNKIMRNFFNKAVNSVLSKNTSTRKKIVVKLKIYYSYASYLANRSVTKS